MSASAASQGSLLLLELRGAKPLTAVTGTWTDKEIPFWQAQATATKETPRWRAFLGLDLELVAGDHQLGVTAKSTTGDAVTCSATIAVKAGRFATEKLKVAPNFVEPNPEQLAKAEEDRKNSAKSSLR